MCGICGFTWNDRTLIKNMANAIEHRGPDDKGYYSDTGISLGMRRLSIIDLSTGKQPIYNEDRSVCIVYNGEVYNFKELKKDLVEKGHRFSTHTDTEVIVHGYEEYGTAFIEKLNGIFGFGIWDSKKKVLLLAVDRFGIKPLYYSFFKNRLIFGSEIKTILQSDEIKINLNKKALIDYLTFRYTPTEQTMFEGIKKLPPAHFMEFSNGEIKIQKYWEPKFDPERGSINYYAEKIREMLKESVRMQMMSDVPLGIYLSGGLDSSMVTAFMKKFTNSEIKTFSVAFEGSAPFNESRYSRMLADYYGTDHHELVVKADSIKHLPSVIWHLDDLDNDPTMIAQYLLSEFTKKKVTVVLTGEGADELFGGYDEFKFMTLADRYRKFTPKFVLKGAAKGSGIVPPKVLNKFFAFSSYLGIKGKERLMQFIDNIDNKEKTYMILTSFFSDEEKKEDYSDDLFDFEKEYGNYIEQIRPYFEGNKKDILNKLIYLDMKRRLPYHLLHKMDKMSMAHSIEGRVPFLDNNLVDFSFKIPTKLKLRGFEQKYILKKAAHGLLPKEILKRKKHPFVVPMNSWFKGGLKDVAENMLNDSVVCEKYFKKEALKKILINYEKSSLYYGRQLFAIISFDVWHKIYIENGSLKAPKDIYQLYN